MVGVVKYVSNASSENEPKLDIVVGKANSENSAYIVDDLECNAKSEVNFKGAGAIGGTFNLANAALGAGMLTFPCAFACTGIAAGFVMQVIFASLQWFTLVVLAEAAKITCADSLTDMSYRLLGRRSGRLAVILLILFAFFVNVVYLQAISEQIGELLENLELDNDSFYTNEKVILVCTGTLLVFPLFSLRDISSLSWGSCVAVVGCAYVALFVFVSFWISPEAPKSDECKPGDYQDFPEPSFWLIFKSIPFFCFGYQNQISSVPNYAELTPRAKSKYPYIALCGSLASFFTYTFVGIAGAFMFGGCAVEKSLILQNFPLNNIGANIGRVSVAMAVGASYPIVGFTGRQEVCKILEATIANQGWTFSARNIFAGSARRRLFWVGTIWYIATLCFALGVDNLSWTFILSGATCAISIFVFPGLFAMKVANLSHEGSIAQALLELPHEELGSAELSWAHGLRDRITYRLTSTQRRCLWSIGVFVGLCGVVVLLMIILLFAKNIHDKYCPELN